MITIRDSTIKLNIDKELTEEFIDIIKNEVQKTDKFNEIELSLLRNILRELRRMK